MVAKNDSGDRGTASGGATDESTAERRVEELLSGADAMDPRQFHLAFARLEAKIRAVPKEELVHINLDVPSVIAQILGVVPRLEPFREALSKLWDFDFEKFDKLEDYALALGHACTVYRVADEGPKDAPALAAKLAETRDDFYAAAYSLARHEYIDMKRLKRLYDGGRGYRSIAFDVLGLVELFLEGWDKITGNTPLRMADLTSARLDARRLMGAIGIDVNGTSDEALIRAQAFTLAVRAYDEVRRGMTYLRWRHGDTDSIIPSLYAGRGGRKASTTEADPEPELPAREAARVEKEKETLSVGAGFSPSGADDAAPARAVTSGAEAAGSGTGSAPIPVGFPGSPPFVRS